MAVAVGRSSRKRNEPNPFPTDFVRSTAVAHTQSRKNSAFLILIARPP